MLVSDEINQFSLFVDLISVKKLDMVEKTNRKNIQLNDECAARRGWVYQQFFLSISKTKGLCAASAKGEQGEHLEADSHR